jgi:putative membrane protein
MAIMQLESKLAKAIYVSCLTIFLTGLASWAVLAHQDTPGARSAPANAQMSDAHFVREAALGGMAEIQLGRLAADRGSNEVVKAFGERMVVQHGAAADQLNAAAQKENVTLPTKLSSREQQTYDRLAHLSGSAFDRAYAKDMVEDHEKDLADFQNEANTGKNENMKAVAAQTIPMIQEHLNQAREMLKTVSQTSSHLTGSRPSGK